MIEERRKWIREYLEQTNFAALPPKSKDFMEKDKVKPPLTPEEEELKRIEEEQKKKEKKAKKDAKKAGKKGKKAK